MAKPQQAVQVQQPGLVEAKKGTERLVEFFQAHRHKIDAVIPSGYPEDRLIGMLRLAIAKDYKIAGCTSVSAFNAVATAIRCGLEIGYQESYLVPFGKECTWIPDYRGMIKIAYKAGAIHWMRPVLVRERDEFDFGAPGEIHHKPFKFDLKDGRMVPITEDEAGAIIGGYCMTMLSSGHRLPVEFTPIWELNKIRDKATARLARKDGPWFAWPERMHLKTLIKREWHWIPRDDRMIHALEADNAVESRGKLDNIIDVEPLGSSEDLIDPTYAQPEEGMPKRASETAASREPGDMTEEEMREADPEFMAQVGK